VKKINEKPILFSSEMIRAILDGRKTMTRRSMKGMFKYGSAISENGVIINCPYGKPGDRLWVRETWAEKHEGFAYKASAPEACWENAKWKPSIHMPRIASRITLEITNIRIERLQDITEEDAIREGVEMLPGYNLKFYKNYNSNSQHWLETAKHSFQSLWQSINGPLSWDKNPFVWVVEFKVLEDTRG
jgi:hypothetical protein